MKINYPFEFKELLLTDTVLDVLGFTEYHDGTGDYGDRMLYLGSEGNDERLISKKEYASYLIYDMDEKEDGADGYGYGEPEYSSQSFTTKDFHRIYFLHEMYEDILMRRTPEEIQYFIELTKKKRINMFPYIESWVNFKDNLIC